MFRFVTHISCYLDYTDNLIDSQFPPGAAFPTGAHHFSNTHDAETTRKGLAAAVKGEAPKKVERLIDLYRQRGLNMTHADIVAMNCSLNPLD